MRCFGWSSLLWKSRIQRICQVSFSWELCFETWAEGFRYKLLPHTHLIHVWCLCHSCYMAKSLVDRLSSYSGRSALFSLEAIGDLVLHGMSCLGLVFVPQAMWNFEGRVGFVVHMPSFWICEISIGKLGSFVFVYSLETRELHLFRVCKQYTRWKVRGVGFVCICGFVGKAEVLASFGSVYSSEYRELHCGCVFIGVSRAIFVLGMEAA